MSIKLLLDVMSQPSRSVLLFCRAANIAHELHPIALRRHEHQTESYAGVNPFQTVPTVLDGPVALRDSAATLRYLSQTRRDVPDHWFPREDALGEARVNEYLHWQHANVRDKCMRFFHARWYHPLKAGRPPDMREVGRERKAMEAGLDKVENIWLRDGDNK